MNNLEWLYENDRDALLEFFGCWPTCGICPLRKAGKCNMKEASCESKRRAWLEAEHETCDTCNHGNCFKTHHRQGVLACNYYDYADYVDACERECDIKQAKEGA